MVASMIPKGEKKYNNEIPGKVLQLPQNHLIPDVHNDE
jgi:hypothetical protein